MICAVYVCWAGDSSGGGSELFVQQWVDSIETNNTTRSATTRLYFYAHAYLLIVQFG